MVVKELLKEGNKRGLTNLLYSKFLHQRSTRMCTRIYSNFYASVYVQQLFFLLLLIRAKAEKESKTRKWSKSKHHHHSKSSSKQLTVTVLLFLIVVIVVVLGSRSNDDGRRTKGKKSAKRTVEKIAAEIDR